MTDTDQPKSIWGKLNDFLYKPELPESFGPAPASKFKEAVTSPDLSQFSDDAWNRVALNMTFRKYEVGMFSQSVKACDRVLRKIEAARIEYSTLEPLELRVKVVEWLEYYESLAKQDREDAFKRLEVAQLKEVLGR